MVGAITNFTIPRWLEGHFIVFNEAMFGVIFIDLKLMYTFHRSSLPVTGEEYAGMLPGFTFYREG